VVSVSGMIGFGSSRVGIATRAKNAIPTKIPTNRPVARDYGRTAAIKFRRIELFL
jgi:hypothetical protein